MVAFIGAGTPITAQGMQAAADICHVPLPALWSVIAVETSGSGFLPDRRPNILFERHVFSRLTGGRFDADDPDVSQKSQGGYGPGGAHQYERLASAILLDETAALQSASWGLGQIMGENCTTVGFDRVHDMVAAMVRSEDNQLAAMASFLAASGMAGALASGDWAGFARRYNGPNYASNNYDGHLQHFFQIYSAGALPDLKVRAAQLYLSYRGYPLGTIDGVFGPKTKSAIESFQTGAGMAVDGQVSDALLDALSA